MSEFRQASQADRDAVAACVRACGRYVRTYFEMRNLPQHYDDGHVWIADDDTGVTAFAVAVPLKREPVTSLYEFGVRPDRRGTGLGRRLLAAASVDRPLRLVVDEANTGAVLFYLKCGLELTTPRPLPTRSSGNVWRMRGTCVA